MNMELMLMQIKYYNIRLGIEFYDHRPVVYISAMADVGCDVLNVSNYALSAIHMHEQNIAEEYSSECLSLAQ